MKKLLFLIIPLFALMLSCNSSRNSDIATEDLKNTRWVLIELNSQKITGMKQDLYVIFKLNSDAFNGFGGCNEISGKYEYDGKSLKLSNVGSTKINCTDGEDKYESELMNVLKTFENFKIVQKNLYLLKGDKVLAKFEAIFL